MNPFSQVITPEFKTLFDNAIDALLAQSGLTVACKLVYKTEPSSTSSLCNNCIFDPITKLSSNTYNGTGPVSFENNAVCPVCLGSGFSTQTNTEGTVEEILYLGVISDAKSFVRLTTPIANIPDGSIQTLCSIDYLYKLKNASYMVMDPSLSAYANYSYERAGDPEPTGFGNNRYIVTIWKRK